MHSQELLQDFEGDFLSIDGFFVANNDDDCAGK
jgi:hypothetical protein